MQFGLPLLYSATYVRHDVALPAFARRIPQQQQPINISCPPAGLTAANLQQRICCCGPMLGQIDGRTPYRYIDPAPNSTRAVAVRITAKSLLIPDRPLQDVALAHSASLPPSRVFGLDNWLLSIHLPPYSASSFTCVADMPHRRRLRSASTEQLDVPTCRRSTIGGRAFPAAAAKVWNGLPSDVTSASSLSVFKNRLKTYLFRRCYETV